jgi:hypothetical protein
MRRNPVHGNATPHEESVTIEVVERKYAMRVS